METKTIRAAIAAAITIAASAALPSFADRTLNDGLAVYMPFDTSVTNNAAINSSVKPVKSGSPTSAAGGAVGNCLNIPSGAYVTLNGTKTTELAFENSNKSFTAIVWANYGTQTDDPAIWGNKDWSGGGKIGVVLATQNSGGAKFNAGNGKGSGTVRWDATFTGEGSGHWTFYAAVCTNGTFTIYQGKSDGTLTTQAGSLSGFTLATGNPFRLGQDGRGSYSSKFVGKLDDFALWTRSLSATQITNIYEAGLSGTALGGLLDNVIVASDTPGAEGTEASGGYRKDGAYTFTAPATVTVGDTVYNIFGYRLERWNQASVKWETVGEYTGGSFAYDSASYDTTIRITWKWYDADEPTIAVWTGAANNNNFSDPGNWSCTNSIGQATVNAVPPDERTVKYILAADADWTSTNLTLAAGVTLDLNGHNLVVANITGSGTVVDLANDPDHTFYADVNGIMYLEMEYLQTTGTYSGNSYNWGNQYIDTGYHHNSNTVTDVKVALIGNTGNWYCYYGARDGYNDNQFGGWIHGTKHYKAVQAAEGDLSKTFTVNVPFVTHLEQNGPCTIDGWQFDTGKGNTSGNLTDWLFAINHNNNVGGSYMAKARMYYCVIQEKDGENLVVMRNFRPVMRISDGKPGMLDIENGVFYVNARTGDDFLVLPVKKSATPAASSLTITVAANETLSLANVTHIGGNIKVVKAGAGTLTVPTTGVYFTGGIDVSAGTLSIPGPVTSIEGSNLGNVTVASGAKVTIPATDGLKYGEAFTLNGGTLELVCSGTAEPVTTYITNSVALNAGAKIRFDTSSLASLTFLLSTDGFTLGEGVASAVSCAELSSPTETIAEADGANGILVTVLTEPATATYTGLGTNPLDFTDPDNWACTNAVGGELTGKIPTSNTAVTVSDGAAFQVTNGAYFVCESIKFDNVTLPDGADLRGLDISKVAADSVFDLQGRTLLLGGANGTSADAFTITDTSSGTPGTLRWEVSGSAVFTCGANLAGVLKLRKEGTGTFVAAKTGQTYTGGTDVVAGKVKVGVSGDGLFGTGVLSLPTGTTLELDGKTGCGSANVVLSGGTIQNSAAASARLPRVLTLTADSEIKHANGSSGANDLNVPANCEWNLGGNKLTVSMAGNDNDFYFSEPSSGWNVMSNGTIKIEVGTSGSKNGYFQIRRLYGKDGLNLDIGTTYPRYRGNNWSSVWGYASNPISNANVDNTKSDGTSAGSAGIEVYGLFKPQTTKSLNLKMMGGSMLDLSAKTGSFSCNFDSARVGGTQKLTFGSGTVTVDLHGRADLETLAAQTDSRVVTWSSQPTGTTFALDAETGKRYKVKSESNGLYLKKFRGFLMIVR